MLSKNPPSFLIKIISEGAKVLWRSFYKSLQQEIAYSREMARMRYNHVQNEEKSSCINAISLAEALKILNIDNLEKPEAVEEKFRKMFELNEKSKGGSFYLQSKILRAKERVDAEIANNRNKTEIRDEEQ